MKKFSSPLRRINISYKQRGQASVLSSYGMIIEYFSGGEYPLEVFFRKYLSFFKLEHSSSYKIEDIITRHFHDHCYLGKMRKLEFVHAFHLQDFFKTRDICRIIQWKAIKRTIDFGEILDLRMKLIDGGLAMIVYPTSTIEHHCVILGFDREEKQFFKRDPAKRQITPEDFLLRTPISEYILFGE